METLLSGVLSKLGDQGIEKISQSAGIDAGLAKTILSQAGPLIIGKMADNAKKPDGLSSLDTALNDHDGSIFDRLDDVVNPQVDTKGNKILGHIFGDTVGGVVDAVAGNNNTDSSSVGKLLEMAAPLVLGQLGSTKKASAMDSSGLFDLLQTEKKTTAQSNDSLLMKLAGTFLDKDGDGDVKDDLLKMAMNKIFGKK